VGSRAWSGLAVLVAGALTVVLALPRGSSNAATPANLVGTSTNAGNVLTVNVREIPPPSDGSSVVFNLAELGNVDWFQLSGVPCSNPYYPLGPFGYCNTPGQGDGYVGRRGGYLAVSSASGQGLSWRNLFADAVKEPGSETSYRGVYEARDGSVTYEWNPGEGTPSDVPWQYGTDAPWGWKNDADAGNEYDHPSAALKPGNNFEGVFYDPAGYGRGTSSNSGPYRDDSTAAGYEIAVSADDDNGDPVDHPRVLRFVGGAWQADATVTVTPTVLEGGGEKPLEESVDFYPGRLSAGTDKVNALYTVYIPEGYGAVIRVEIDSIMEEKGHVMLGGAALSDNEFDFNAGAELSALSMTKIAALDAPAVFNLSDPGGTERPVDGWLHASVMPDDGTGALFARYDGPKRAKTIPDFWYPNNDCSGYVRADSENDVQGQLKMAPDLAADSKVMWSSYWHNPGWSDGQYASDPPYGKGLPTPYGLSTEKCARNDLGMMKLTAGINEDTDRYFYIFVGAWGGEYQVTATFGSSANSTTSHATRKSESEHDKPVSMTLWRIRVPAGQTAEVVFSVPTSASPYSSFVFAGASLQHTPSWNSCNVGYSAVAGGHLGVLRPDDQTEASWKDLLYDEVSDEIAGAPYFQQFQLRGLLNHIDLAKASDPSVVADNVQIKLERGALAAAYCEAVAWPRPSGLSPNDSDKLFSPTNQHPNQVGYGADNDHAQDKAFFQEGDEAPSSPGDENHTTSAESESNKLHQPMVSLTMRAFTCTGTDYDAAMTDPNKLVSADSDDPNGVRLDDCQEIPDDGEVPSGSRVYWLYTVRNIGLFGFLKPTASSLNVDDLVTLEIPCELTWQLTPPAAPSTIASFAATGIESTGVIAPGYARACVASEVFW
jgi:hypothetical protein